MSRDEVNGVLSIVTARDVTIATASSFSYRLRNKRFIMVRTCAQSTPVLFRVILSTGKYSIFGFNETEGIEQIQTAESYRSHVRRGKLRRLDFEASDCRYGVVVFFNV